MRGYSWIFLLFVFVVGYFVGVKFPNTGTTALAQVGM